MKCIYIDPPYNTGGDGFIYKDSYQHSSWASLIANTLPLANRIQSNNGVIFASIDDDEQALFRNIFNQNYGSQNFINNIIWQKKFSPQNDAKWFSDNHDFIISFAKNKEIWKPSLLPRSDKNEAAYTNPDNDPRGAWTSSDFTVKTYNPEYDYPITTPSGKIISPTQGRCWATSKENFEKLVLDNRIWFGKTGNNVPRLKKFITEVKDGVTPLTLWTYDEVGHNQEAKKELVSCFNVGVEISTEAMSKTTPKPIRLLSRILTIGAKNSDSLILDYFAGSGTTAHAVINLNREDGGKRKYILVEQGEYFDTVLKPRVQKVLYAKEWKEGKPVPHPSACGSSPQNEGSENGLVSNSAQNKNDFGGVSQIVKVLKLESYEDTLNNLQLKKADLFDSLPEAVQTDYLLHYMLNVESRTSLLSTEIFQKPFDYQLNIARDSAGSYQPQIIDLVETFNYLLGLNIIAIRDKRERDGIVFVTGYLPQKTEQPVLIIWRDCELVDYQKLPELLAAEQIELGNKKFALVYINGDHNLPTVWAQEDGVTQSLKIRQIEAEFLRLMFEEAQ